MKNRFCGKSGVGIVSCGMLFLTCFSSLSFARLLNLPQSPVVSTSAVPPNVMIQLDDSGSMDWEYLGAPVWEGCAYDPNFTGVHSASTVCGTKWVEDSGLRSYANGRYLNFNYIFNNSDNVYRLYNPTGCGYIGSLAINALEACPGAGQLDWRFYAPSQNYMYYNPDIMYLPWEGNCASGVTCTDASFSRAHAYPVQGHSGNNLLRDLAGFEYHVWIDDRGYSGGRPLRAGAVNATNQPNGEVDLWDSHVKIVVNSNNAKVYSTTYAPSPAGLNPTTTLQATLSGNACFNVLGPASLVQSIFRQELSYTSTGATGCMTLSDAQTNVANWYQYARRRSMAARGVLVQLLNKYPFFNWGFNTINDEKFLEVPPEGTTDFTPYTNAIIQTLLDFDWNALGTPNRSAMARIGEYYQGDLRRTTNPITAACQQNYTIFMTDGYWNDSDSLPRYIGDEDRDGISDTFADVAYYYYINNLQPRFTKDQVRPNAWDPATWLHNVTFTVGFGVSGNLVPGEDGWPQPPLAINGNWGNPYQSQAAKADDLWHAAFNTRGSYVAAQNPIAAVTALSGILSNISVRAASYSVAAQNSSILNARSAVYQATTNGTEGNVQSFNVSSIGKVSSVANWSAQCLLTGGQCSNPSGKYIALSPSQRVIITRDWSGSNDGAAFQWPADYTEYKEGRRLPTNIESFLSNAPHGATTSSRRKIRENQAYGQALLDYLRGDRSHESQNGGSYNFRDRSGILGDIHGASPVYVGGPSANFPDSLETGAYSRFVSTYADRAPIVYVGANDGMLHGFHADTGKEVLAYVPGVRQIYEQLPNLSQSQYQHNFFVDGAITVGDTFFKAAWHTILVGTLQNGGQGVFALDITDPARFSEQNARTLYLWEFTDEDDEDVGYVYGPVSITKVLTAPNQSKWAVIFSNGYNNTQSDGYASRDGQATLFILILDDFKGKWELNKNYYKILVGSGSRGTPSGLAAPFGANVSERYRSDYVYAGDLEGNLWRFDLSKGNPGNWKNAASLLFTAEHNRSGDQPITTQPVVGVHPKGIQYGVMVYFGTGKLLEPSDNTEKGQVIQTFYGIWDRLQNTAVSKSQLVEQEIIGTAKGKDGNNYRLVTSNTVNWEPKATPKNLGWYMNLIEAGAATHNGERVISPAMLRNNNVIFTTFIPSSNHCSPGGTSWLMELYAGTGGTPLATPFDTNHSGTFDKEDYFNVTQKGQTYLVPAAGVQSPVGQISGPAVFLAADKATEYKVLSGATGLDSVAENPATGPEGRQSWKQIQ